MRIPTALPITVEQLNEGCPGLGYLFEKRVLSGTQRQRHHLISGNGLGPVSILLLWRETPEGHTFWVGVSRIYRRRFMQDPIAEYTALDDAGYSEALHTLLRVRLPKSSAQLVEELLFEKEDKGACETFLL